MMSGWMGKSFDNACGLLRKKRTFNGNGGNLLINNDYPKSFIFGDFVIVVEIPQKLICKT